VDPEVFRRYGHQLVDWVADYRQGIEQRPVMSPVLPGDIRRGLPARAPEGPEEFGAVLRDLDRLILPGITHWNHPSFFAYFPSNMTLPAVLAELVIAGLGPQCMSWQTSPAAAELEEAMMEWLRQMLGLPAEFTGAIHDTASTATLCALLCARERTTDFGQNRGGLQAESAPLVVYASDQVHSSMNKAALLAGFGKDNVRLVETDDTHAMNADKLAAAVEEDLRVGRRPCAVVATVGSTGTTAVDPLARVAETAGRHRMWLHVDAAMAGTAMILPECRWMWEGIEKADSLVLNPHKWMGTGFDLSAYYVRDSHHLIRVMSTNPSYLQTVQDAEVKNYRDWGIPLGRRFRAMKFWFLVREQGVKGLQERLRRDLRNAAWLKDTVDEDAEWERMAPVVLQTVCIRHVPAAMNDEVALAAHNLAIADRVNKSGRAYLTPSVLKGKQMLRVSIGAELTERSHVEALWRELRAAARA
jgi:aromatic-L-amino-acid decarboxylase